MTAARRVTFSRNHTISLSRTCHAPAAIAPSRRPARICGSRRKWNASSTRRYGGERRSCWSSRARIRRSIRTIIVRYVRSDSRTSWPTSYGLVSERALDRGLLPTRTSGSWRALSWRACGRSRLTGIDAPERQPRARTAPRIADHIHCAGSRPSGPPASCGSRSRAASLSGSESPTPIVSGPSMHCPDMTDLIAYARQRLPGVGIQLPPNLADWWPELVAAGATDLGGLSPNGDRISPTHPVPSPARVRQRLASRAIAISERLCTYSAYLSPDWLDRRVLDVVKARY
jgi:hypothetical protein